MNPILNDPEEEIEIFTNMIHSTHNSVQLEGLVGLRIHISVGDNRKSFSTYLLPNNPIQAPIQKVVDSGIVPKLLEIMVCEDDFRFQIESSWCVVNVCSGEDKFVDYILDLGGLDILINLFDSENNEVVSNAISSVGNIAGTGSKYRDMCIQKDCMEKFLQLLETRPIGDILDDTISAISNLCAGSPPPDWEKVLPALPVLHNILVYQYQEEALINALWAIVYIAGAEENIQQVIDQDCIPYLLGCLNNTNPRTLLPAVRALGRLLTGTDTQADAVLGFDVFLPRIFELATNDARKIRREAFWVISNIARGTFDQIEMIFENDDFLERLKTAVATESEMVSHEVAWAISSILSCGSSNQIYRAIEKHGFLESLTQILTINDKDLKDNTLKAIVIVLENEGSPNLEILEKIEQTGLLEIIQDLEQDSDYEENIEKIMAYFSQKENDKEEERKINCKEDQENVASED